MNIHSCRTYYENVYNYEPHSSTSKKYQETRHPESEINWDSNGNGGTYYGGKKLRKSHNSKKTTQIKEISYYL